MQKRILNNKNIHKRPSFSTPIKKNHHLKRNQNNKKSLKKFVAASLLLFLVVGVYGIYNVLDAKSSLGPSNTSYIHLSKTCDKYTTQNTGIKSVLVLNFDSSEQVNSVILNLYNKDKVVKLDFSDVRFNIDKSSKTGSFKEYFQNNNLYMDTQKASDNLFNLFLKEFSLKVDYIFLGDETFNLDPFLTTIQPTIFNKIVGTTRVKADSGKVYSNLCRDNLYNLSIDYLKEGRRVIEAKYSTKTDLSSYFSFTDIKKEQARIHISNKSGVEGWGSVMKEILENYGITVVKVDDSSEAVNTNHIYFENKDLESSATSNQIKSLISHDSKETETSIRESIFADVYLELGRDSLINY
jgi:hypothetical protein